MKIFRHYKGVADILKKYWTIYGGLPSLLCSPYVHFSVLITIFTFHYWYNYAWWTQAISVLPNLLGFTLGGFAVFLGFGSDKFKELISGQTASSGSSPYLSISVTFLHFVLVQLAALLWAIIASTVHFNPPTWLGCSANFFISINPISDALCLILLIVSTASMMSIGQNMAGAILGLINLILCYVLLSHINSERKRATQL
jgi:hypothetical protein